MGPMDSWYCVMGVRVEIWKKRKMGRAKKMLTKSRPSIQSLSMAKQKLNFRMDDPDRWRAFERLCPRRDHSTFPWPLTCP